MALKLVIANKAYSSWSFRPWILLRHFDIPFEEVVIPMAQDDTRATMLRYAPTGKCPSLHDGDISVWDSLAIIEYVADFPALAIWPCDRAARAMRVRSSRDAFGLYRLALASADGVSPGGQETRADAGGRSDLARIEAAFAEAEPGSALAAPFSSEISRRPTRCSRRSSSGSVLMMRRSARGTRTYMDSGDGAARLA